MKRSKRDIFPLIPGLFAREFGDLEQFPNENAEFKVLLCGRGDEEYFELKGYNLVVQAFTDHRLQMKPYHLLFVGAPVKLFLRPLFLRLIFLHPGLMQSLTSLSLGILSQVHWL